MKKKFAYSVGAFVCFMLAAILVLRAKAAHERESESLPTYFAYSPASIEDLRKLDSSLLISVSSLQKWDEVMEQTFDDLKLGHYDALRLCTYLYVAQKEAGFLAYNALEHFQGSLDPICEGVLKLFNKEYQRPSNFQTDPFSEKLAAIVLPKLKERIQKENAIATIYKVPDDYLKRKETSYNLGASVAKWIPWFAAPTVQYWPQDPPREDDPEWKKQITLIKQAQKNLSKSQKEAILFWAGMSGKESGDWRKIANDYLFENDVPIGKMLLVRSTLMMGLYDASIAYISAKYHYVVVRPQIKDPSVEYAIRCPNHPSYPSGHSTGSMTAALILSYYFPQNSREWKRLAEEAGQSRIWAGIHYPLDHEGGKQSGKAVAEAVIQGTESLSGS